MLPHRIHRYCQAAAEFQTIAQAADSRLVSQKHDQQQCPDRPEELASRTVHPNGPVQRHDDYVLRWRYGQVNFRKLA